MGLLAQQDAASAWDWPLTDGLGSIRAVVDDAGNPLHALHYAPYGEPFGGTGTPQLPHGFTGEPTDGNGLVYLRARYYLPSRGVFPSLDPVEDGNRYAYVGGNVVNNTDPSGRQCQGQGCDDPDEGPGGGAVVIANNSSAMLLIPGDGYFHDPNVAPWAKTGELFIAPVPLSTLARSTLLSRSYSNYPVAKIQSVVPGPVSLREFLVSYETEAALTKYVDYFGHSEIIAKSVSPLSLLYNDPYHLGLLGPLTAPSNQGEPSQPPDPGKYDQCNSSNVQCDAHLSNLEAAREYARIANSSYYTTMQQSVKSSLLAVVAVSKVRLASGLCAEVAAMNSGLLKMRGAQVLNLEIARSVFLYRALARQALSFAPRLEQIDISSTPTGEFVSGHAEDNLLQLITRLGPQALASWRAIGLSNKPCTYGNKGCSTAFSSRYAYLGLAYFDPASGRIMP